MRVSLITSRRLGGATQMKCGRDADWPVEVRLSPNKQKPKAQPPFENQTPESAGGSQNRSCTTDKTNSPLTDQSVDYSVLSPCTNDAPRTCVPTSKKVLAYFGKQHCKREKTATRLTSNTSDSGKRKGGGMPRTSVRAGTPPPIQVRPERFLPQTAATRGAPSETQRCQPPPAPV